jgi:putative ABC transport system permease protein
MKYLRLILANLKRKKLRTTLTIGSFTVALFLFGLLAAIRVAFSGGVEVAGADRLVVINKVSIIQPLPISYRDKIAAIAGVKDVTYATWFGGVYQDEKNFFPQFAIDPESWRKAYPEYIVPADEWKAFLADRQGCIAGEATAKRFGWKIGDRIPIKGSYLTGMWEFNLRGIYTGKRPDDDTTQFWFQRKYLDEHGPAWYKGLVGWYVVRVADPQGAAGIAKTIDDKFANSPYETKTDTEKAFAASFAKQMGDIEFLIMTIGGVVFFTLLLVTGNTMAIAVRERVNEIAVLKTVGYGDRLVLWLVLAESLAVALVGGGLGLLLIKGFTSHGGPLLAQIKAMVGVFYLPGGAMALGLALALTVGLAAGILPAVSAMRLRVVDALRRV